MELKALRNLNLKQQLLFVESYLPDAYEYLHDTAGVPQPTFDDNDELISWRAIPKVTPQVTPQEEKE